MTTNLVSSDTSDSAYVYSFHTLKSHEPIPLASFKNQVLMIVNTASKCGFTPQYAKLEALYEKYKEQGFVILGIPSNDFGSQEPGDDEAIGQFCQVNYGVSFPMATKEVVSGKNAHPFYRWAKKKLGFGSAPKWNFHKYLISRDGQLIDYFLSTTSPDSGRVIKQIEILLNESSI